MFYVWAFWTPSIYNPFDTIAGFPLGELFARSECFAACSIVWKQILRNIYFQTMEQAAKNSPSGKPAYIHKSLISISCPFIVIGPILT